MSKGWYPVIDYDKCVGCMACNDMCQHGVYKPNEETAKPKVVYGNGCVHGCHGCERKCPVGAIHYYGDDGTLDLDYDFATYKPELECDGKPNVPCQYAENWGLDDPSGMSDDVFKKTISSIYERMLKLKEKLS